MKKDVSKDANKKEESVKKAKDLNQKSKEEEIDDEEWPTIKAKRPLPTWDPHIDPNILEDNAEDDEINELIEEINEENSLAQSIAKSNKQILLLKKPEGSVNPIQMQYDIDDEWLREQYVDKKYSANKIAKSLGISYQTVSKILLAHGISRYNTNEMLRYENQVYSLLMANPDYFIEDVVEKLKIDEPTVRKIYQNMKENGKAQKINEELRRRKNE